MNKKKNDIKVDIDSLNQTELDQKTTESLESHGVTNKLNASYILEVGKAVHSSDIAQFVGLYPHFYIQKTEAWKKSLCVAIAFLRRYKLEFSLEAIEIEYQHLPNETGFKRGRDLDQFFANLFEQAAFKNKTFEENLQQFNELNGLSSPINVESFSHVNLEASSSINAEPSSSIKKPLKTSSLKKSTKKASKKSKK